MTPARWTFLVVFGLGSGLGLVIGLINLVAPDATTIMLNDVKVTGMTGFWTALISGAIPSAIFGLIIAGIVALFTRKKKVKA
ncbi:MAG: hypothetical protein ABI398_06980 [Devosia sp.]